MSDISTLWDTTRGDWSLLGADLVGGNDIVTAVLISLFSDREANPDDTIPDGSRDARGWWGDDGQDLIGSRLWLIDRAKKTQQTLALAKEYIEEALQWLIDDGVVSKIDVYVEWTRINTLGAQVTVYRPGNPAPIKLATQNVFGLAQVQSWGWNEDQAVGEWKPKALAQERFDYYTSILYPFLVEDTMTQGIPAVTSGYLVNFGNDSMTQGIPSLLLGTLVSSVNYVDYINGRDVSPDTMTQGIPTLLSGTLVVTVSYVDYLNQRDVAPDTMTQGIPSLLAGTLAVTVAYVDYVNGRDVTPDTMTQAIPALISGTLT